jgi:hypothetical protein
MCDTKMVCVENITYDQLLEIDDIPQLDDVPM